MVIQDMHIQPIGHQDILVICFEVYGELYRAYSHIYTHPMLFVKRQKTKSLLFCFVEKNEEITWFFGFRQTDIFNFQHSPATGPLKTVSAAQELLFIIVKWKIREQLTGGFQWRKRDKSALLGALKM